MLGLLIGFMIFIFPSSFVYAASAPGTELDFADEWKGTFSGYTKKAYLVIEDETEWQEVWDKALPNESSVPDIDFDDYIIIAVFMGEQTHSGYSASIVDIYDKNRTENSPYVYVLESYNQYGSSRPVQPYHIVALLRDDFPEDTDFDDTEFDIRTHVNTNNSTSSAPYYRPYPYSGYGLPSGYGSYGNYGNFGGYSGYNWNQPYYGWNQPYGWGYPYYGWNQPSYGRNQPPWGIPSAPYGYGSYSYDVNRWPGDPFAQRGFNPTWAVDPYPWLAATNYPPVSPSWPPPGMEYNPFSGSFYIPGQYYPGQYYPGQY